MAYISLREQGFGDYSDRIQQTGARLLQQRMQREEELRAQQAHAENIRRAKAANTIAETEASDAGGTLARRIDRENLGNEVVRTNLDQDKQMFPTRLRGAAAGANMAELSFNDANYLSPYKRADAQMGSRMNEQRLFEATNPLTETADTQLDAAGNIIETVTATRGGQPAGVQSRVIRGNRPAGGNGQVVYYPETDPETGMTTRVPYKIGTDEQGNPVRLPLPVAGAPAEDMAPQVPEAVINKYFEPDGTPKKAGGFFGIGAKPMIDKPASATDAAALRSLRSNPKAMAKYNIQTESKAEAKPAAEKKTRQSSFDKLEVGATFMQNGVRYKKTGEKSAEPVGE